MSPYPFVIQSSKARIGVVDDPVQAVLTDALDGAPTASVTSADKLLTNSPKLARSPLSGKPLPSHSCRRSRSLMPCSVDQPTESDRTFASPLSACSMSLFLVSVIPLYFSFSSPAVA